MIVFVAGMQRSGSTYTYNVCREFLELDGSVYGEATAQVATAVEHAAGAKHIILKDHAGSTELLSLVSAGEVKAICSIRPVEEAVASWMDTFGFDLDTAISHLRQWFQMYRVIEPAALTIPYGSIEHDRIGVAMAISKFLQLSVDRGIVVRIADKYSREKVRQLTDSMSRDSANVKDIEFSFYDKTTFFHRHHVSSRDKRLPEDHLSADDLARVRTEFAEAIEFLKPRLGGSR